MSDKKQIVLLASEFDAQIEHGAKTAVMEVGQWFWVKENKHEWFGCAMEIGSNYVEIRAPVLHGSQYERVHFKDIQKVLRKEEHPQVVIQSKIKYWSIESNRLLAEVKKLTAALGLKTAGALTSEIAPSGGTALVMMSGKEDIHEYKRALIKATEKTLPELFEKIRDAHKEMAAWMTIETYPLQAQVEAMNGVIGQAKERIFNVSLYAGLAEDAVKCCPGKPATLDDKLHVFQRRLYMDEECLLNYDAGGMEFKNIAAFDKWICLPENRDRILPFPRTLVAMRVRRNEKERGCDGSMLSAFINFKMHETDKYTFLYVRNGEQVWRVSCEMEFDEMIFPDKSLYDPSEPMMMRRFCNKVDELVKVGEYEARLAEYESLRKKDRWKSGFVPEQWEKFDQSSVYFDDTLAEIEAKIKEYNRVAVIIQGIFDRSLVLHPHHKVETWNAAGFEQAIKLVYDAHMVLDNGDPPDFEAYRVKCNASINSSSILTGQYPYWLDAERERESKRRAHDYRLSENERYNSLNWWKPAYNPGPKKVCAPKEWSPRANRAKFSWTKERKGWSSYDLGDLPASIKVPASHLFNISAYKIGDYKQFFQDHRTRQEYLKWAPLLLAAEDFYGKKRS